MAGIDFWFSIGSTYSYLSVMRLPQVVGETGVSFHWRPFNVRAIMREMDRGGQIYVIHNRVHDIDILAERLRRIVPEARSITLSTKSRLREICSA